MEKVILLRTPLSTQLTPTQQRIWKVLQQDNNRELSIRKICTLAGYRTVTPWYDAIQDTPFRAMIETLGIVIDRQHPPLSQRVALSREDAEVEWQKDVIDIRCLISDYPKHWPAGNFRLDFSCVSNSQLKQLIKRYFRARVGFWESITFNHTLIDMKPFLIALSSRYSDLESFALLTREMVVFLAEQGYTVDRKRVRRLMELMGLETIYPKPHLSLPGEASIRYPWITISEFPLLCAARRGLIAIVDWFLH